MYYPKHQIQTGFYSNNTLAKIATKKPYTGPYFNTSDGKSFSGKEPNDGPNIELIPLPNPTIQRKPTPAFDEGDESGLFAFTGQVKNYFPQKLQHSKIEADRLGFEDTIIRAGHADPINDVVPTKFFNSKGELIDGFDLKSMPKDKEIWGRDFLAEAGENLDLEKLEPAVEENKNNEEITELYAELEALEEVLAVSEDDEDIKKEIEDKKQEIVNLKSESKVVVEEEKEEQEEKEEKEREEKEEGKNKNRGKE